ncbi:tetratricopeptide repeat protein [Catelliglobosispora koreensis]|uniref:tetratricopeptide repeat protein n=1 Tax=Catelliglobosispora koreensis TaxID=129052 RepID=UPI00036A3373|nr:tetratricopeptide repeat protein [Catelliglobosispora koreensis]
MSEQRPGQSIFTRGAVDLSALASRPAPASAQPEEAAAPRPADATWVDVTEANVQAEVLERSLQTPVVVAFVVDHPEVNPYFDDLAKQNADDGGTWILARVDLQSQPRLAQMFRVQSVPMVFAIVGGQPVDAVPGLLPPSDLRKWLDAVLKAGGVEVEVPEDPRLAEADEHLMMGELDEAEAAYKKILSDSPRNEGAEAGLAHVTLAKRVKGADPADALAKAQAAPDDLKAQMLAADVEVLAGQAEQAYQRLVNLVRRVYGDDREAVRQHLLSLFAVAGPDDPAVATARRSLASALF